MQPRWLVTGAGGMLGQDLRLALARENIPHKGFSRSELDITDSTAVKSAVSGYDVVVNTAAWTAVDAAEQDETSATAVNGGGAANLAEACMASGAVLLQISTDYVFDGTARSPYQEDSPTSPLNAYGRSKLVGETAVLTSLPEKGYILRAAWLYGEHGPNFVRTMLELASKRETLEVVSDQFGQPTWTGALAELIIQLGRKAVAGDASPGIYHGSARGETTWFDFTRAIFIEAGLNPDRILPLSYNEFQARRDGVLAPRPSYSVLGHQKWQDAGISSPLPWEEMLRDALQRPIFQKAIDVARSGVNRVSI